MKHRLLTQMIVLLGAAGCVDDAELDDGDGADDSFLSDGKADTGGVAEGTTSARAVLRFVSLPSTTAATLSAVPGLSSRAEDNILAVRLGDDELAGTEDDEVFETLAELDAVPYVGPIAFRRLTGHAIAQLTLPAPPGCDGEPEWQEEIATDDLWGLKHAFTADHAGNSHLALQRYDGVYYATNAGGAWTVEKAVDGCQLGYASRNLAVDEFGIAHIACVRCDGTQPCMPVVANNTTGRWIAEAAIDDAYQRILIEHPRRVVKADHVSLVLDRSIGVASVAFNRESTPYETSVIERAVKHGEWRVEPELVGVYDGHWKAFQSLDQCAAPTGGGRIVYGSGYWNTEKVATLEGTVLATNSDDAIHYGRRVTCAVGEDGTLHTLYQALTNEWRDIGGDFPQIFAGNQLRYVVLNADGTTTEELIDEEAWVSYEVGRLGEEQSLAMDSRGRLVVSYNSVAGAKVARRDADGWRIHVLGLDADPNPTYTSVGIDGADLLHVAYRDRNWRIHIARQTCR